MWEYDFTGDDFFIESLVDLPNPYVGQQLIHTFRFYQALQVYRQPQYEEPLFREFETMGLPVREYNLEAAGRTVDEHSFADRCCRHKVRLMLR